jgi:hypothetical protein
MEINKQTILDNAVKGSTILTGSEGLGHAVVKGEKVWSSYNNNKSTDFGEKVGDALVDGDFLGRGGVDLASKFMNGKNVQFSDVVNLFDKGTQDRYEAGKNLVTKQQTGVSAFENGAVLAGLNKNLIKNGKDSFTGFSNLATGKNKDTKSAIDAGLSGAQFFADLTGNDQFSGQLAGGTYLYNSVQNDWNAGKFDDPLGADGFGSYADAAYGFGMLTGNEDIAKTGLAFSNVSNTVNSGANLSTWNGASMWAGAASSVANLLNLPQGVRDTFDWASKITSFMANPLLGALSFGVGMLADWLTPKPPRIGKVPYYSQNIEDGNGASTAITQSDDNTVTVTRKNTEVTKLSDSEAAGKSNVSNALQPGESLKVGQEIMSDTGNCKVRFDEKQGLVSQQKNGAGGWDTVWRADTGNGAPAPGSLAMVNQTTGKLSVYEPAANIKGAKATGAKNEFVETWTSNGSFDPKNGQGVLHATSGGAKEFQIGQKQSNGNINWNALKFTDAFNGGFCGIGSYSRKADYGSPVAQKGTTPIKLPKEVNGEKVGFFDRADQAIKAVRLSNGLLAMKMVTESGKEIGYLEKTVGGEFEAMEYSKLEVKIREQEAANQKLSKERTEYNNKISIRNQQQVVVARQYSELQNTPGQGLNVVLTSRIPDRKAAAKPKAKIKVQARPTVDVSISFAKSQSNVKLLEAKFIGALA